MRKIFTLTMSGLVTVLTVALTIYVIWWLVNTVEGWLRRALIALHIVRPENYWPGLGLITGFFLLLAVGSLVNAYAGKIFLKYWDDLLGRIPLVKTLYGGFRDVVSLLPSGCRGSSSRRHCPGTLPMPLRRNQRPTTILRGGLRPRARSKRAAMPGRSRPPPPLPSSAPLRARRRKPPGRRRRRSTSRSRPANSNPTIRSRRGCA